MVSPKPPPDRVRPPPDAARPALPPDEDDDPFRLRLDPATRPRAAAAAAWLQERGVPEDALAVAFAPATASVVAVAATWCAGARAASALDLGPLYILGTIILAIYCNLGTRGAGDASAYAVFNAGFRELLGTLRAADVDGALRRGQL